MKQVIITFCVLFFTIGYTYSQVDVTQPQAKPDTISSHEIQEDIASSLMSIAEGLSDSESGSEFVPSLLHASPDVYVNNTAYTFSIAFFRNRGYDNQYQDVCFNGYAMNSMITGRASFSQWGGLNHVVRWPERVTNMSSSTFTFGNIGGATNYDLRASGYRKQVRASYSLSNRSYNNRFMVTAATGALKGGWSAVASASARFGTDLTFAKKYGAVTDYTGFGAFLGVEKKFNQEHALNLTAFVSPTERGMQAGAAQEAFDLVGSNYYNPNWGWYEGKKRNVRMRTVTEPMALLTHYYTPKSNKFTITTTVATSFGRNNTTGLNWYDVPDPRPDYYRNLPSFYLNNGDTAMYLVNRNKWLTDENTRQIDWLKMYTVNQLAASDDKRAQYVVENRVIDHVEVGGTSFLNMNLTNNINLSAGVDIRGLKQHNYKTINDLLGGAYWLDIDKFALGMNPDEDNVQYNNLDDLDENGDAPRLYVGDKFAYDYNFMVHTQKAWAMLNFIYPKIDFHVGGQLGATEMWRVGLMRNGRFPTDDATKGSVGKSLTKSFFEGGAKAGITYKITGRNYLALNGEFLNTAPSILNVFLAPRIRNTYIAELKTEKIASIDVSYIMKYQFMKMRASLFFTQFYDMSKVFSYYSDDDATMVNDAITGMNQRHLGAELGAEVKLFSMLWLVFAGTFGDYRYSNSPMKYTNFENGTGEQDRGERVYWKNYFVTGSPQIAGTLGLKFNHNYWWVNINANYFDRIYCAINPDTRTSEFRGSTPEDDPLFLKIIEQQRLKGQFTLDASISKSWRIKRYTIGFNISVTNILNNKKLVTTAWEAYRFDYNTMNPERYPNKYYYAYGTTFFAGFNFTFN